MINAIKILAVFAIIIASTSLGCSESKPPTAASNELPTASETAASRETATIEPDDTRPKDLVRKGGWFRLDRSKLDLKHERKQVDGAQMFVSGFVPKSPMLLSMKCPDDSEFGERCDEYQMGHDYYIQKIWMYDHNRADFAAVVEMKRSDQMETSAMYIRRFLDTDGDGFFETLTSAALGENIEVLPERVNK